MKHTMKHLIRLFTAAILFAAAPTFAQTATTQTTLSAAMTAGSTTAQLTSATNVVVNSALYIDNEGMTVTAISGTTATVQRGTIIGGGGPVMAHAINAVVWVATQSQANTVFHIGDYSGTCVASQQLFLPVVNTLNGNVQTCNMITATQGFWGGVDLAQANTYMTWPITSITNKNYNALLTDVLVVFENFVGNNASSQAGVTWNVTLPAANAVPGHTITVKDGIGSANGNYSIKILSSQNIDGSAGGSTLTTAFQAKRFISDGANWFTW